MSSSSFAPLVDMLGPTHVPHAPVIESAGGLVWRVRDGELQVKLVHRPRYDDWSWPKGKLDPGEAFQTAAVREVAEETGRPVVLGVPLPGLQYLTPEGRVKRVHYWAARQAKRVRDAGPLAARAPVPPVSVDEIDDSVWLGVEDAARRVTRKADRGPLAALAEEFAQDRLATRVVVIARHGKAVTRAAWHGAEEDRPLTPAGHAQSAALVPVLAAYGVNAVVTSRWNRCEQTISPYAEAARLDRISIDHLSEAQHERSPSRVARTVRELLESERSTVLCTHRPVLPTVLDVLGQHSRRPVANALPSRDPFLEPGEMLVAHVADTAKGPRVLAAEKVAPPLH
ncbi:NUDIX hydrolase [Oerskovia paurometabola]|uniref:NUDIX domain-containing protein n=1 Tax=Oerskovia paurometabola TaxID=162170 RepID=A0ABW1X8G4_9CELL|nr:NUDIX hydrolase [Oerskovia paurometabola]MBM7496058.1 8-oxo-dGTP diphosphatase [Oerskovia paurometabola]